MAPGVLSLQNRCFCCRSPSSSYVHQLDLFSCGHDVVQPCAYWAVCVCVCVCVCAYTRDTLAVEGDLRHGCGWEFFDHPAAQHGHQRSDRVACCARTTRYELTRSVQFVFDPLSLEARVTHRGSIPHAEVEQFPPRQLVLPSIRLVQLWSQRCTAMCLLGDMCVAAPSHMQLVRPSVRLVQLWS